MTAPDVPAARTSPGRTVVFFGDSVTDCQHRNDPDGLGQGYVRILAEGPLEADRVVNSGISGNRVTDLQDRVEADVIAHEPDVVSVLIGINDTWRRFDRDDPTSTEAYEAGYRDVLQRVASTGADLVLMEPFVIPVTDEQATDWRDDLDPRIAVVHGLADEFGAIVVPTDAVLNATAAATSAATLASDGVHPTSAGHLAIAELWASVVGAADTRVDTGAADAGTAGTGARKADGSAGDADYGTIGVDYRSFRQPEPEFEVAIAAQLGDARTVLNVGAGAGSYEPRDREVTAVEPSESMRNQRPAELVAAIDATAEDLPFDDNSFDAAMTTFSVHQWTDLDAGLTELRRVTRGPIVIMTCDPARLDRSWLTDYAPEVIATEARRYPSPARIASVLGDDTRIVPLPIPLNCVDGFSEAYYGRPEILLDPGARRANSAWSFIDPAIAEEYVDHLRRDLESGAWDERHAHLRSQSHFDGSLVLVVSDH